jgi:UDP-N-acetylglucosamine--N-acetylmuramyl-(pentapeptide) pyrophosphoryl-undecaprenol N-acetylglucosamine transferase
LFSGNPTKFQEKYNFSSQKQNLLVMGGSQGAQAINNFIYNNINDLLESFNIFHICGSGKIKPINKPNYRQTDYLHSEMADAYAWAEIVLSRAGASTISEISALNKKAILIPLSTKQSRGEQILNAEYFASTNKGVLLKETNLNLDSFKKSIENLNGKQIPDSSANLQNNFNPGLFTKYLLSTDQ